MRVLAPLERKALRDAWGMAGQLLAIALVLGCGLGVFLALGASMVTLDGARADHYARERFAHVFSGLVRAPAAIRTDLAALPGVERAHTRIVATVTLDMPGMYESVAARMVSLPDTPSAGPSGAPPVNSLRLRSGRWPDPRRGEEVLVSQPFADAHGLKPGDDLRALLNGRFETLRMVGTALAPEFIYAVGPGMLFADDLRFGILWVAEDTAAAAFDLEGACNDVCLRLNPGASTREVIHRVDLLLEPYGGVGAIDREDHPSALFVANELEQLRTFGVAVPMLFLGLAGFLLHVVMGRILAEQRTQIATLKALGFRDREIAWHYAQVVLVVVAVGSVVGVLLARWMGAGMTASYGAHFHFPSLAFHIPWRLLVLGIGVVLVAALLGGGWAILKTVRMPPAEGMRPEAPASFRATWMERIGLHRLVGPAGRMILRELERRPTRAVLTASGIVMAAALLVVSLFGFDSMRRMMNVHFGLSQRASTYVGLAEARDTAGFGAVAHLPGVLRGEPFRTVPVELRHGHLRRHASITGVSADGVLHSSRDQRLAAIPVPPAGLVLSDRVAEQLGVVAGDALRVRVLEGRRRTREVTVARVVDTYVGIGCYMELGELGRLLGQTPTYTGAWLQLDRARTPELHQAVRETPMLSGASGREESLRRMKSLLDEGIGTTIGITGALSFVMALGVLYNAARLTLAARARELASLRVLGYRRGEVGAILLGELGLLTVVGLPIGLLLGRSFAAALVASPGWQSDQFRLPLVIEPSTYAMSAAVVLAAAGVAGWSAWRRLQKIDIVDVLKTRD